MKEGESTEVVVVPQWSIGLVNHEPTGVAQLKTRANLIICCVGQI